MRRQGVALSVTGRQLSDLYSVLQGGVTNCQNCAKSLHGKQAPSLAGNSLEPSFPAAWDSWGNFNDLSSGVSRL